MNGHLMIRPTCEKDAAALARIYAYYVEKTAITFEYTAPDTTEMERRRQEISQRYPYLVPNQTTTSSAMPMPMHSMAVKPTPGRWNRVSTSM